MAQTKFNINPDETLISGVMKRVDGEYPYINHFEKVSKNYKKELLMPDPNFSGQGDVPMIPDTAKIATLQDPNDAFKKYNNVSFPITCQFENEPAKSFWVNTIPGMYKIEPSVFPPRKDNNGRDVSADNLVLKKDAKYLLINSKDYNDRGIYTGLEIAEAVKRERSMRHTPAPTQTPDPDIEP